MGRGTIDWAALNSAVAALPVAPFCVLEYENMGSVENALIILQQDAKDIFEKASIIK